MEGVDAASGLVEASQEGVDGQSSGPFGQMGSCVMESIYGPRTDGPSTALTSLTSRNSHGTSRNSLSHGESHQAATSAAFRPTKSNSTHVSTGFFLPGPRRRQNEV